MAGSIITELPHSISEAHLSILGVDLVVHHLSNGQAIIEAESLHALFEAMAGEQQMTPDDATALASIISNHFHNLE